MEPISNWLMGILIGYLCYMFTLTVFYFITTKPKNNAKNTGRRPTRVRQKDAG